MKGSPVQVRASALKVPVNSTTAGIFDDDSKLVGEAIPIRRRQRRRRSTPSQGPPRDTGVLQRRGRAAGGSAVVDRRLTTRGQAGGPFLGFCINIVGVGDRQGTLV